jgi:eukaryotic translation initiation factor 2C
MLQIPGSRLTDSLVRYQGSTTSINQHTGRWNLVERGDKRRFLQGSQSTQAVNYLILHENVPATAQIYGDKFGQLLSGYGVATKYNALGPKGGFPIEGNRTSGLLLGKALKQCANCEGIDQVPDIIILVLRSKDQAVYSEFKYLAERCYGFQMICMTEEANMSRGRIELRNLDQYMGNVMMKANLKVGGINHSVTGIHQHLNNTLVLGADVTHPGFGALSGTPSIAAVVGSVDNTGGMFLGSMCLQKGREEVSYTQGSSFIY